MGVRVGSFRLVIRGNGGGVSACVEHLELPELARLTRALAYSFAALQRMPIEGVTEKDNFPALTSWIANNKTHWSLGRNLLVNARHAMMEKGEGFGSANVAKVPGHGLPCLTFIDPPDALRNDPYGDVTDEQAIRKSFQAAGWLTIITKPIVPVKRVFTPQTQTQNPRPLSGLVPRKAPLFKRGTPDE